MSLDSLSTGKSPIQSAKIDIIPVPESLNPSELDNVHLRAPVTAQIAFSKRRIPRLHKEVSFSKRRVSHATSSTKASASTLFGSNSRALPLSPNFAPQISRKRPGPNAEDAEETLHCNISLGNVE
ncbi:hypothetical protein PENFLA_c086G05073 [Penicillium flavigenum]|uniref:Uncharacterized protein n=1 Tax=Penicillium flavigenum TaxID=254877 RepID=A0A1V6SA27_9EURO|nr:hypothetical protein PENFLA_c086G05073 [Penicillium flavigenum]